MLIVNKVKMTKFPPKELLITILLMTYGVKTDFLVFLAKMCRKTY